MSPFLDPGLDSQPNSLAVLHLRRDLQIPILLREEDELNQGYLEGKVTNTRFGSFPHSTLIGVPWGSQVRASAVDTGSRGRKGLDRKAGKGEKRKREPQFDASTRVRIDDDETPDPKAAVVASTGFAHLLPPTPECWTMSLPHRTQVVYTPDYSYILHRLRARPGKVLIEAGAGSGSFTHAAARAVFNGYPSGRDRDSLEKPSKRRNGKVWSYEFHGQRVEKLQTEIREHRLDGVVEITHRDVCSDGFAPTEASIQAVQADAVFLDLPAPWLALEHLTRITTTKIKQLDRSDHAEYTKNCMPGDNKAECGDRDTQSRLLLNPNSAIRICTFSPCIEQVQRTVATMRRLGWLEIDMVEIAAKRIEVRREHVGLQEEGLRGVNASPASVEEAVARLRELEGKTKTFHEDIPTNVVNSLAGNSPDAGSLYISKQQRLANIRDAQASRKLYSEGNLVHRTEAELKTHTSYLVFAILPREWTSEDEKRAQSQWPSKAEVLAKRNENPSRRQLKRIAKIEAGGNMEFEAMQEVELNEF
ncbi:tRNA (adenine-N(1)-)-methyltransferase catalytic subunit trm61 [Varicellaria rhodocarpa]|nr:tRNA (adenine-N(1)-)-methyltransferase catalytic subunit trm61 [Varicellaria rhodocarpa]